MVRLADLPEVEARHLVSKPCPPFPTEPFVAGPPVRQAKSDYQTLSGVGVTRLPHASSVESQSYVRICSAGRSIVMSF